MKSATTQRFRKAFDELPEIIQENAKRAYSLWEKDPFHKSLQFKQIHKIQAIFSVRIGLSWRALGVKEKNNMIWFWIGSHADYDKLINSL